MAIEIRKVDGSGIQLMALVAYTMASIDVTNAIRTTLATPDSAGVDALIDSNGDTDI